MTYRGAPHATADDPGRYVDAERVRAAREEECVGRFEDHLRELGVLDERAIAGIRDEALAEMQAAIEEAESRPAPDPALRLRHDLCRAPAGAATRPGVRPGADAETPVMNLVQAVNDGLRQEMARDDAVMVLGEDVATAGRGLPRDGGPAR